MRRLIVTSLALVGGIAAIVFATGATDSGGYRVMAIFDNANQITVGEQTRVAGVTIGVVEKLDVTNDNKAAVTLRIDDPGYQDFRSDAKCTIRAQSLIGEQFVECTPTRPKPAGAPAAPPLTMIQSGQGEGSYLLPVTNTSSPVGVDLINNIMRVPERQRFALILNEFGVTLAGNGAELNDVIRRAYPGLQETNKVLAILASQNKLLAGLAVKSDKSLGPLARERKSISRLINSSEQVGRATAEKGQQLQDQWKLFPEFLRQLKPTMADLESFSNAFGGFLTPLSTKTSEINSIVANLPNFSANSTSSLTSLGATAVTGKTVFTDPAVLESLDKAKRMAKGLNPFANGLGGLLASLQKTGGWEFLMQTIYFQTASVNGYNKYGHYSRGEIMTYPKGVCVTPFAYRAGFYSDCSANFATGPNGAGAAAASASRALSRMSSLTGGLLGRKVAPMKLPEPPRARPVKPSAPTGPSTPATPPTGGGTTGAPSGGGEGGTPSAQPADKPAQAATKRELLNYLIGGSGR